LRNEMVNIPVAKYNIPLFSLQAKNTAKAEIIP
jgi:hypothetical protein